jgi:hypothetical protein
LAFRFLGEALFEPDRDPPMQQAIGRFANKEAEALSSQSV